MTSNRFTKSCGYALGATLALSSVTAFATDADRTLPAPDHRAQPAASAPAPITLAQASPAILTDVAVSGTAAHTIRPMELRVRQAASEGPTALRRYVERTAPIYHYSFWDYAKYLPRE